MSLEADFWNALKDIAQRRGETLSHLITTIDRNRKFANLSSALRVFVLRHYIDQSGRQRETFEQRVIPVQ